MAFWERVCFKAVAGEPIIPITGLSRRAFGATSAHLAQDIRTIQRSNLKTILRGLLLCISRQISRCDKRVDDRLVLADPVREHAAVVTIVTDAPLHSDRVAAGVGHDWRVAPVCGGLVVVDAHAGVVAAGSGTTDCRGS